MSAAPRLSTRRKAKPRNPYKYTYIPFRPGPELKDRIQRVADRLAARSPDGRRVTVSSVVRQCCLGHLPHLERQR